MKTILIVNPQAGRRFFLNLHLPQVIKLLERHGVSFRVFFTRHSGHAANLVRRFRDQIDCVLVFGGDGTIREVVKGLEDRPLPIGIIPFGTVNVLALDLGISLNPIIATTSILAGHTRRIDVGYVNSEPFLLMVSTGLDAMAVHTVGLRFKRYLGQMAYVLGMIWSALTDRVRRIQISVEGQNITDRGYLAIVSNSRYYAGPYTLDEDVRIDDGILNVILFKKSGILDTLRLLINILANRHRMMPDVSFYSGKVIHIRSRGRIKMQMDGDKAPSPPARISIRERFLPVFVHGEEKRPEGLEAVKTVLANVFTPSTTKFIRR
ncbi:MAG: diacylglycerol kinase family lipid kinase [Spirochaetaceae bacterium]|nr:MAG: diacylglycerol kinase family lipid kinase [Spirochaetaceae bacterium]